MKFLLAGARTSTSAVGAANTVCVIAIAAQKRTRRRAKVKAAIEGSEINF